jgi:hypothetical protein
MLGMGCVWITGGERSVKYIVSVSANWLGVGTIWILQAANLVFSVSLDHRTVEKISVHAPFNCLGFFWCAGHYRLLPWLEWIGVDHGGVATGCGFGGMGEAFAGPGAGFLPEKGDHCFSVFSSAIA